jgi:hypothetical protein
MSAWGRFGRVWVACMAWLLTSAGARAEYHHRVLLLERTGSDPRDHEVMTRVRAELSAAGFDVLVLPVVEEDPKLAVESAGRELRPASVLLVERVSRTASDEDIGGTELWLADRMLGKTVVLRLRPAPRDTLGSDTSDSNEAARVAVQAVELVKARLAELSLTRQREEAASKPPPPSPPPPPPVERETRGARPNLAGALGMLEGFRDGQRALTPVVRLGVALPEGWTGEILALELRGSFVGLGGAARVTHGPGAATLRHTMIGLDAVMRFGPGRRIQPFVSLGAGMLALDVTGDAPEPYRNESERTLSGLVNVSAGVWLQPVSGFGLVLEGQLMNAWSKTVVRIAGDAATEVAAPLLLLSAGPMVQF